MQHSNPAADTLKNDFEYFLMQYNGKICSTVMTEWQQVCETLTDQHSMMDLVKLTRIYFQYRPMEYTNNLLGQCFFDFEMLLKNYFKQMRNKLCKVEDNILWCLFSKLLAATIPLVLVDEQDALILAKMSDVLNTAIENGMDAMQQYNVEIQMREVIRRLIEHNMLLPEILNYLYHSHRYKEPITYNFTFFSIGDEDAKTSDRLEFVSTKLECLIELNKAYPLKNNQRLLTLIEDKKDVRKKPTDNSFILVSEQLNDVRKQYILPVYTLLLIGFMNDNECTLRVLPLDIIGLLLQSLAKPVSFCAGVKRNLLAELDESDSDNDMEVCSSYSL
jgi:hypothetical protein